MGKQRLTSKAAKPTKNAVRAMSKPSSSSSKSAPLHKDGNMKQKGENFYHKGSKLKRLRMIREGRPTRNAKGQIVKAAPFQATVAEAPVVRVQPDRRWFGNTRVVGQKELDQAVRASGILFGGSLDGITENTFEQLFAIRTEAFVEVADAFANIGKVLGGVPRVFIEKTKLDGSGLPLVELLIHSGLCPSKGQARKDLEGGGVNINNVREANAARAVTANDLLFGKHILLRKGKKNYVVVTAK